MKKPMTISLILLTMSASTHVLAQALTLAQAALAQTHAVLVEVQATRVTQFVHLSQPTMVTLAQAQPTVPAVTPIAAAPAVAQAATMQPTWTKAELQGATYMVLTASMDGEPDTFSADQQRTLLTAMEHDLQGAVMRKYPAARFVTDPSIPGVITLRPVLTVPAALVLSNSVQVRVEMRQNEGSMILKDNFGMLELYLHQTEVANYIFDKMVSDLP